MNIGFVDTHAHLYDKSFEQDINDVIIRAKENGVHAVLMPNCDKETLLHMLALEKKDSSFFKSMLGLHPCYVKKDYQEQLTFLKKRLDMESYCAIGEIGLDFYWDTSFKAQQYEAFETQIDWAISYDLPIVIHTREAMKEGIEVVQKKQDGNLKGVFHCFTGDLQEAKKIVNLNFKLGIGGISTFKNGGLEEIIKEIPLSNIVLETDAPYLAPNPHRGKRNESAYISLIAQTIANIKGISLEEVAMETTQNAYGLFKIK